MHWMQEHECERLKKHSRVHVVFTVRGIPSYQPMTEEHTAQCKLAEVTLLGPASLWWVTLRINNHNTVLVRKRKWGRERDCTGIMMSSLSCMPLTSAGFHLSQWEERRMKNSFPNVHHNHIWAQWINGQMTTVKTLIWCSMEYLSWLCAIFWIRLPAIFLSDDGQCYTKIFIFQWFDLHFQFFSPETCH